MVEIDIIQQIEQFYNSAWDKLIMTGSIIFGVFGILIPIIFQLLQNRSLRLQEKEIKLDIGNQLAKQKKELQGEIKKEYQDEIKRLTEDFDNKAMGLQGMGHHLQGNGYLRDKLYISATHDFIWAAHSYLIAEDYHNLKTVTNLLLNTCFKKISKEDFNDLFHQHDMTFDEYFEKLKKADKNYIAKEVITELKYCAGKLPEKQSGK